MTPLLAVKKLVKIPFQDFCHLDDRATRSENTPVVQIVLCCTNCTLLYKLYFVVQIVLCYSSCALLYKCDLLYKFCFVVQILLCCTNFALLYKFCFVVQVVLFCTSCAFLYKFCFVVQVVLCSKALELTLKSEDDAREVNSFESENTEINFYFI